MGPLVIPICINMLLSLVLLKLGIAFHHDECFCSAEIFFGGDKGPPDKVSLVAVDGFFYQPSCIFKINHVKLTSLAVHILCDRITFFREPHLCRSS